MTHTPQQKSHLELAQVIVDAMAPVGVLMTAIWGVVQTGPDPTTPPTLTATLGGDPTPVSNIAFSDGYSPSAGDKVLVVEMGTDRFVLCAQAS